MGTNTQGRRHLTFLLFHGGVGFFLIFFLKKVMVDFHRPTHLGPLSTSQINVSGTDKVLRASRAHAPYVVR
jgi:hypothetical protein